MFHQYSVTVVHVRRPYLYLFQFFVDYLLKQIKVVSFVVNVSIVSSANKYNGNLMLNKEVKCKLGKEMTKDREPCEASQVTLR